MKKFISLVLSLAMLFSLAVPALAADSSMTASVGTQSSGFVDAEGKLNTVNITIPQIGSSHVEYYIDNILTYVVDATIPNSGSTRSIADTVSFTCTDVRTNTTIQYTEALSNYIVSEQVITGPANRASYAYQGQINFKTFYDDFGERHTDKLSIYQQTGTTTDEYKTLRVAEGVLAAAAISALAAVLTIVFPPLAIAASDLFYAAAYAVGASFIGGVVQGLIQKTYYVHLTNFNIKAVDPSTSRERIYDAERYQIALDGGGYSSEYYYDGYLPWSDSTIVYWMFSDFWGYTYPGVSSFS